MQKKVVIIAGEASGDALGAKLIKSMLDYNGCLEFKGIGGEKMLSAGLDGSVFPMSEISLMGYAEIISKIPKLLLRIRQAFKFISDYKPDLIITIDSYGFNSRLVKKIRKLWGKTVPIIHYVAPTVWAYGPKRAQKTADLYDHLLLILPFEKPYFEAVKLPCTYVGHPIIEDSKPIVDEDVLRKKYDFRKGCKIVTIAPGSRMGEIKRHMQIVCESIKELLIWDKNLVFIIPTLSNLEGVINEYCAKFGVINNVKVVSDEEKRRDIVIISNAALVKSGTIALEFTKLGIPMVIAYKISSITAFFLKRKLKIRYVSICNLILDEPLIPELLQENFTASNVIRELKKLLDPNGESRNIQHKGFATVLEKLENDEKICPSKKAAKAVLKYL